MASTNQLLAQIDLAESLGVVDDYLRSLYSFKEDNDHQFFANLFPRFMDDTVLRLTKIEVLLNENVVDFSTLVEHALSIVGSAGSAGAFRVKMACYNLRMAADDCSKDRCLQFLDVAKKEYAVVKPHLDAILEVERDIFLNGNRLQG